MCGVSLSHFYDMVVLFKSSRKSGYRNQSAEVMQACSVVVIHENAHGLVGLIFVRMFFGPSNVIFPLGTWFQAFPGHAPKHVISYRNKLPMRSYLLSITSPKSSVVLANSCALHACEMAVRVALE